MQPFFFKKKGLNYALVHKICQNYANVRQYKKICLSAANCLKMDQNF